MKLWSYCILSATLACVLYESMIIAGSKVPTRKVKVTKIGDDRNEWTIAAQDTEFNPQTVYGSVNITKATNSGFGLPIPKNGEFFINVSNAGLAGANGTTKIEAALSPKIKSIELANDGQIRLVTADGTEILNSNGIVNKHIDKKPALKKVKVTKLDKKNKDKWTITSNSPDNLEYGRVVITSSTNPGRGLPIPKQRAFSIQVSATGPTLYKKTEIGAETTPTIKSIELTADGTAQIVS